LATLVFAVHAANGTERSVAGGPPIPEPSDASTPAAPSASVEQGQPAGVNSKRAQKGDWKYHFGLPFAFGGGSFYQRTGHTTGGWWRVRAMLLVSPPREATTPAVLHADGRPGDFGVGPYFDVGAFPVNPSREYAVGAGINAAFWLSEHAVLAPNLGWYRQTLNAHSIEQGVTLGLLFGRMCYEDWGSYLFPWGVRAETRFGFGPRHERSWLGGFEFESLFPPLLTAGVLFFLATDWRFD
jgi:hypothetical protein